jgi:hypothetical protein
MTIEVSIVPRIQDPMKLQGFGLELAPQGRQEFDQLVARERERTEVIARRAFSHSSAAEYGSPVHDHVTPQRLARQT